MAETIYPDNLNRLHKEEEILRERAVVCACKNLRLLLHFSTAERALDLIDVFRKMPTDDEDLKVVQALGFRIFNAVASAIKLMMSGYSQTSAMLLRDVLETVFLLDLFRTDRPAIARWRKADAKTLRQEFAPARVRKTLDDRDGFTSRKREELYRLFSELAGHPSMKGFSMLRPKGMGAHMGPFLDPSALEATVSELGRLAVQVGEHINGFFPDTWNKGQATRLEFQTAKASWIKEFYEMKAAAAPPQETAPSKLAEAPRAAPDAAPPPSPVAVPVTPAAPPAATSAKVTAAPANLSSKK